MVQLIDKSAVVAEIERRYKISLIGAHSAFRNGKIEALREIKDFLNTLETKDVNLEKELERLDRTLYDLDGIAIAGTSSYLTVEDVKQIAKNFFELGVRTKDVNEIIKTAEDHAYFAGSENTRKKLVDKACEWLSHTDFCHYYNKEFIDNFRKAMEE